MLLLICCRFRSSTTADGEPGAKPALPSPAKGTPTKLSSPKDTEAAPDATPAARKSLVGPDDAADEEDEEGDAPQPLEEKQGEQEEEESFLTSLQVR